MARTPAAGRDCRVGARYVLKKRENWISNVISAWCRRGVGKSSMKLDVIQSQLLGHRPHHPT